MTTVVIRKVAKVGLGVMGSSVAWSCAVNGLETYLYDHSEEQLRKCIDTLNGWFFDGNLPEEQAKASSARLHPCKNLQEAVSGVDLVFESVFEDLKIKQEVHADIGRLAKEHVLQGSNTSSLLCSPLAEASGRPDRFFNMNFTDPHQGDELVEVMWNPKTSDTTKKAALHWARTLRMVPIVCKKETMGYCFNRIWRAIKREALSLADMEAADPHDIDRAWMLAFGLPFGPFSMMDRIGLDTVRDVEMRYYEATEDERDKPPRILEEMIKAGHYGEKSDKGFYAYPNPEHKEPGWLRKEPPWSEKEG